MALFNTTQQRGIIKGELFEIAVLYLLQQNNFSKIQVRANGKEIAPGRVRETRERFIELKGRGEWHQIDCPCEYDYTSAFMYPIRLIGEVKYHNQPIDKEDIRAFIGVLKDISENYFVPTYSQRESCEEFLPCRYLEVGAFFSAVGFSKSAELLAYAHGIKVISYKDNYMVYRIKQVIDSFEKNIAYETFNNNRRTILGYINQQLINNCSASYNNYVADYTELNPKLRARVKNFTNKLIDSILLIKSNVFVTTHEGVMLHLLGDRRFPDEVFYESDEAYCQIHYEVHVDDQLDKARNKKNNTIKRQKEKSDAPNEYISWYLTIDNDSTHTRFYFTPPQMLQNALDSDKEKLLDTKETMFKKLSFRRNLQGKQRSLTLKIDKYWLDELRERV